MSTLDTTRPAGVRNTAILMAVILGLEVVLMVTSLGTIARLAGTNRGPFLRGGVGLFSMSYSLVTFVIAAVFVYFYWKGQNVARWAVLVDSGWVLLQTVFAGFSLFLIRSSLPLAHSTLYASFALNFVKSGLAIYFFWYLNQPNVKAWFLSSEVLPVAGGAMYPPAPYAQTPSFPPPVQPVDTVATPTPQQGPPPPPPAGTGFTV